MASESSSSRKCAAIRQKPSKLTLPVPVEKHRGHNLSECTVIAGSRHSIQQILTIRSKVLHEKLKIKSDGQDFVRLNRTRNLLRFYKSPPMDPVMNVHNPTNTPCIISLKSILILSHRLCSVFRTDLFSCSHRFCKYS